MQVQLLGFQVLPILSILLLIGSGIRISLRSPTSCGLGDSHSHQELWWLSGAGVQGSEIPPHCQFWTLGASPILNPLAGRSLESYWGWCQTLKLPFFQHFLLKVWLSVLQSNFILLPLTSFYENFNLRLFMEGPARSQKIAHREQPGRKLKLQAEQERHVLRGWAERQRKLEGGEPVWSPGWDSPEHTPVPVQPIISASFLSPGWICLPTAHKSISQPEERAVCVDHHGTDDFGIAMPGSIHEIDLQEQFCLKRNWTTLFTVSNNSLLIEMASLGFLS